MEFFDECLRFFRCICIRPQKQKSEYEPIFPIFEACDSLSPVTPCHFCQTICSWFEAYFLDLDSFKLKASIEPSIVGHERGKWCAMNLIISENYAKGTVVASVEVGLRADKRQVTVPEFYNSYLANILELSRHSSF